MPAHRVLFTGASGYLGGSLLAHWKDANLPPHEKLYALVRTDAQADAVKTYGAEPLRFDTANREELENVIVKNRITIVLFLIDAIYSTAQVNFIEALAKVRELQGGDVHFVHTSGAKIFSGHAGAPVDKPWLDTDPDLYNIQRSQTSDIEKMQKAIETNNTVIDQCAAKDVRAYIFIPCVVYGRGEGFGKPISIQTGAIVKASKALGRVCSVDAGRPTWPVCHIADNTSLYLRLLHRMLADGSSLHGSEGYYLASSGSVAWLDIYSAFASALARRGLVTNDAVERATPEQQEQMGVALGVYANLVPLQLGGCCTLTAQSGSNIGWKPQFSARHILESAQDEVDGILAALAD